jgi:hypothetical protein
MRGSHVSGGYYCQCPKELAPHLPCVDSSMLFHTTDRRVPPSAFRHIANAGSRNGSSGTGVWKVVMLRLDGGCVGFSGGWRGFAIDQVAQLYNTTHFLCQLCTQFSQEAAVDSDMCLQMLKVGDMVVYEVVSAQRIRAHIFRAAGFEPGGRCAHIWGSARRYWRCSSCVSTSCQLDNL